MPQCLSPSERHIRISRRDLPELTPRILFGAISAHTTTIWDWHYLYQDSGRILRDSERIRKGFEDCGSIYRSCDLLHMSSYSQSAPVSGPRGNGRYVHFIGVGAAAMPPGRLLSSVWPEIVI